MEGTPCRSSVGYKLGYVAGAAPFLVPTGGTIGKVKGNAPRGNHFRVVGVTFADFGACSSKAIKTLESASDLIPAHTFTRLNLVNVSAAGLLFLMDPSPGWANPSDCVEFPCTAPDNILLFVENVQLTDSARSLFPWLESSTNAFKIIGTTNTVAQSLSPPCEARREWNAFVCRDNSLGLL